MLECYLCYNSEKSELEKETLFSDEEGNEAEQDVYICKEGTGCSN